MRARMWGTRGSLPVPGAQTARYGGNTACAEVRVAENATVVLDAGTGMQPLGFAIDESVERVDVLLSHLHMDHIIGLGFFAPLYRPGLEIHLWGPASQTLDLRGRLSRYLSPPLFPVRLRDLPSRVTLHDVPFGTFELPGLEATAALVCHPGPTVGYRLSDGVRSVTYLPDHEPALGVVRFPEEPRWTSGYALAEGADLLIHDAQYTDEEYPAHIGWGHSTIGHAVAFARHVGARRLIAFHHDPRHDDDTLDRLYAAVDAEPAREGDVLEVAA